MIIAGNGHDQGGEGFQGSFANKYRPFIGTLLETCFPDLFKRYLGEKKIKLVFSTIHLV